MLKSALKLILRIFRRLTGAELILQNQRSILKKLDSQRYESGELKHLLLQTISLSKYSLQNADTVQKQPIYSRCAEIVSLLSPMDVSGGDYVRIGRDCDGGYVMLDNFLQVRVEAAYSFGISDDVSWDLDIANRSIDVFMYDHTINKLPKIHSRFNFYKLGITGSKAGENLKTFTELINDNNHIDSNSLILKMDIEGCEWDVFRETPIDLINKFSQIVIEFHGLLPYENNKNYENIIQVLRKINKTHQSIHVHANSMSTPLWIGDMVLPNLLEVTYIRRSDVANKLRSNTRRFPTCLDKPTIEGLPDIELGRFRHNK